MTNFSTNETSAIERGIDTSRIKSFGHNLDTVFELNKCIKWIQNNNYKRVCLQFPDELLCDAPRVSSRLLHGTNAKIFTLADTSYASCCVDVIAAAHVEADAVIHFGSACMSPHAGLPVLYVFEPDQLDVEKLVETMNRATVESGDTLVFYAAPFHVHLPELQEKLRGNGNVFICKIIDHASSDDCTVVCGREIPKKSFNFRRGIFIGSDSMLLTNLTLLLSNLSWYLYESEELREFSFFTSKFLMKRLHLIEKLKDAAAVGVLVGTLSVDGCLQAVDRVKQLCKSSGKKCYTIAVGRPNVAKLANFPEINVFVLISCPQNQLLIDNSDFYQPIMSLLEVELALGRRQWSAEYSLDFRQLQPGGKLFNMALVEVEKNTEADVSLITGKVRQMGFKTLPEVAVGGTDIMSRTPGTLMESHAVQFFSERTWNGLEQNLGETPVEAAVQGRRGVPLVYQDEGLL